MKKIKSTHAASKQRTSDIIQAALECFTDPGFNDTSMADICARANASIGSVYHHFKSKEQLASAVYLEGIAVYQSGIIKILEKEKDAFKGVSSIVEYHLKWIDKNSAWAQFLFQKKIDSSYMADTEEKLFNLNKVFISKISEWFTPHISTGTVRPLSWDLVIALLLGPCQEYTRLYLSKKTAAKIDTAIRELTTAIWRSLST